jgi:hypothetical protein
MQIKIALGYHLIQVKMSIIKETKNNICQQGCGERGPGTIESIQRFLEKLKMELPYDPAIPLGIYPKECKSAFNRDTCTSILIAALFTNAILGDHPRHSSTVELINKMWHM